jgi:hypothetical protein
MRRPERRFVDGRPRCSGLRTTTPRRPRSTFPRPSPAPTEPSLMRLLLAVHGPPTSATSPHTSVSPVVRHSTAQSVVRPLPRSHQGAPSSPRVICPRPDSHGVGTPRDSRRAGRVRSVIGRADAALGIPADARMLGRDPVRCLVLQIANPGSDSAVGTDATSTRSGQSRAIGSSPKRSWLHTGRREECDRQACVDSAARATTRTDQNRPR